ncbi:hypothetical protein [Brasilonema sp. UFV-L1]|uniref:hypothetical protein n=1 Tax=Brasilonema sp. UFV-L1 TaxID=2234130 RepID=UPI00145D1B4E|nr:hypothetical protein [Brasilonema sp. UFV-L1]NMG07008.1 hypothetical protein [Brasilonema sp. UFV-L1]
MKKFRLPIWFPYPSSWLNALILSMFMTGLVALIRRSSGLDSYFAQWSNNLELVTMFVIFIAILPIPAIAFFHHFFLGRFIPAIPGEPTNNIKGFVPGIISWWESLYSWLVFVFSTLIAIFFSTPFLPLFKVSYENFIDSNNQPHKNLQVIFTIFWIISAAIFYHIEYSFKYHLIFGDVVTADSESVKTTSNVPVENKTEIQPTVASVPETKQTEPAPTKKSNLIDWIVKNGKLVKRLFTLVLISLIGLWIYLFTNLPEVKPSLSSAKISLVNQIEVSSQPTPDNGNYTQAINKAKIAARLTKSAQTEDEWKIVLNRWEQAIRLLEKVPLSSENYPMAQQKIIQYQIHREFARQNAAVN